jgi:integrase
LLTAVPFFVVGATWRLPDTYHSAGSGRGTATLKFYEDRDILATTVTIEMALAWAQQAPKSPTGKATTIGPRRMTAVRGFARYPSGIDANTQVPPLGLMPHRAPWRRPFIYSPADIDALMAQARRLASPLRAATYETLIGLLASSGLRIGEAIKSRCRHRSTYGDCLPPSGHACAGRIGQSGRASRGRPSGMVPPVAVRDRGDPGIGGTSSCGTGLRGPVRRRIELTDARRAVLRPPLG